MNCPNCHAHSSRLQTMMEGSKQCTVCGCVFKITESGTQIIKEGQTLLSEVPEGTDYI